MDTLAAVAAGDDDVNSVVCARNDDCADEFGKELRTYVVLLRVSGAGTGMGIEKRSVQNGVGWKPRPWSRIKVCLCGWMRGDIVTGGGKKPGGSGAICN